MTRRTSLLMTTVILAFIVTFFIGCVDDYDLMPLEPPGVVETTMSYWVGDVQVEQRSTKIRSYDYVTYEFRGSVKNLGTTTKTGARFEVTTRAKIDRTIEGLPIYDEQSLIGAVQNMGVLLPQQELPINLSYAYPSFLHRKVEGMFLHD